MQKTPAGTVHLRSLDLDGLKLSLQPGTSGHERL
jgi:hypothetical protein